MNQAAESGGAVFLRDGVNICADQSNFTQNWSFKSGGAIFGENEVTIRV